MTLKFQAQFPYQKIKTTCSSHVSRAAKIFPTTTRPYDRQKISRAITGPRRRRSPPQLQQRHSKQCQSTFSQLSRPSFLPAAPGSFMVSCRRYLVSHPRSEVFEGCRFVDSTEQRISSGRRVIPFTVRGRNYWRAGEICDEEATLYFAYFIVLYWPRR